MSGFFSPYEGRKPYAFISYAHRDSERVLPIITLLHEKLYRVWYDEGIPAGSDWPRNIELHMSCCAAVLFFVSEASLASPNCHNEIAAAVAQGKPLLCLRLDDTPLSGDWPALLADAAFAAPGRTPEDTAQSVLHAGVVDETFLGDGTSDAGGIGGKRGFNAWTLAIALGALLLALTAGGAYGLTRGWFDALLPAQPTPAPMATPAPTPAPTPVPTPAPTIDLSAWGETFTQYVTFPDAQQERAVRAAIGQAEGEVLSADILPVSELHFCGNMVCKDDAGLAFAPDGSCAVHGAPVIEGSVRDLALLADMPSLEKLTLAAQQVTSIQPLRELSRLQELNVAGNPIRELGRLTGFASLRTLRLEHTGIKDLTPLNALPALTKVTLSAEMFPVQTDPATQRYDIVLVP